MHTKLRRLLIFACIIAGTIELVAQKNVIRPTEIWPDKSGNHIQAHGGGIIKVGSIFYWYGEERRQGLDASFHYVSCYSSKDLVNWKFQGDVLKLADPDSIGKNWVLERPKVFYNAKTKKYVMYMHLDGPKGGKPGYVYARVGVAISDKATGPFTYIRSFRPLGFESRDIGQFIDDNGTAYLIFEDRHNGFHIARLSEDYLDVEKDMCLIKEHLEGGALFHYNGLYYVVGSKLTGFNANPNKYATAKSLEGPWSEFKDIAPPKARTYGSQSTMMLKVTGKKDSTVIFMGDIWSMPLSGARYLWMPLEIEDGKLFLPEPKPWTINVKTGEHIILP